MSQTESLCSHLQNFAPRYSETLQCDQCLQKGDTWVHLRICQTCGEVNCCDSSKNQHATKHFHKTNHPTIISGEYGEYWAWCYKDEAFLEF